MNQRHWRQHEPILMEFESAWRNELPPLIDEFLNDIVVDDVTSLLAEVVMIDFEHRWQRDQMVNLDEYFVRFPELRANRNLRDELLSHEIRLRKSAGDSPTDSELNARFNGDSAVIELRDRIGAQLNTSLDSLLNPGVMVGPYRIINRIGQGAFSSVYAALDTDLHREIALKLLTCSDINAASRLRLKREAQAVATLQHPNIVPVFGAGNFQGHDYIVARLVDGITLDQWMKNHTPSVREAVEIVMQLGMALDHAHRAGIVHRDIKPANVMIENDVPLLLDFGLAHMTDNGQNLTHKGDLVGTPAFMPPEQADGRGWQADPRSDIYSLGAMLYLMVFRRLLFEGTTTEIISQILSREASLPRDANAQVSRDLQTIILKCLEKEPSFRYQTAEDLKNDLQSYLDGKPIVARPIGVTGRLVKWSRRRPAVAVLLTGIITLGAFGGGAATQLRHVTAQRDRAQEAEKATQFLLTASAADAGRLAMQRGQFEIAIRHFEQALDRGYPDRTEILLSLVEANFVLRKIDESSQLLSRATAEPFAIEHQAALAMWQAELAMETQPDDGSGEYLFEQAGMLLLSPVDEQYVHGILADSSLQAMESFRKATEIDPYHYRSRRMLIFMLLSLARIEEADLQIRIARQLYPDDLDFLLLNSLALAARGQVEAAARLVQDSSLDNDSKKNWQQFSQRLFEIANGGLFDPDNDSEAIIWLHQLSHQFQQEYLPLLQSRKWRFPPRISRRFKAFMTRLPSLLTEGAEPSANALEELVAIHPEASLFLALGALQLVGVSANVGDRKKDILRLEESRDNFRLSLEHPGFMKQSGQRSWVSVFTTSMTLALVHQHDVEKNKKLFAEASRRVDLETVSSLGQVRAFTIAAIMVNDLGEASRWMKRWIQIQGHDDDSRVDMFWHQAIIFKRQNDWLGVIGSCQSILDLDSEHTAASDLYDLATKNIELVLESGQSQGRDDSKVRHP